MMEAATLGLVSGTIPSCQVSSRRVRFPTGALMTSVIQRECIECGTTLTVVLDEDDSIVEGGIYFGTFDVPDPDTGEWNRVEPSDDVDVIEDREFDTAVWTGEYTTVEYWTCMECYDTPDPGWPELS